MQLEVSLLMAGVGRGWASRSLPNQTILGFCLWVHQYKATEDQKGPRPITTDTSMLFRGAPPQLRGCLTIIVALTGAASVFGTSSPNMTRAKRAKGYPSRNETAQAAQGQSACSTCPWASSRAEQQEGVLHLHPHCWLGGEGISQQSQSWYMTSSEHKLAASPFSDCMKPFLDPKKG